MHLYAIVPIISLRSKEAQASRRLSMVHSLHTKRHCNSGVLVHYAAGKGNLAIFKALVEAGANPMDNQHDINPLMCAIKQGHQEIVEYAIEKLHPRQINAVPAYSFSAALTQGMI